MPFDPSALIKILPYLLGHDQMPAVMEGMRRAEAKRQQDRQLASQDELRQAQMGNLAADNQRSDEAAAMNRLSQYFSVAPKLAQQSMATAEDPVQANLGLAKQLTGAAQSFGVDPALGQAFVPNMTEVVDKKTRKQAQDVLDQLDPAKLAKDPLYAGYVGTPELENLSVQFNGQPKTIGELRKLAGTQLLQGRKAAPPLPVKGKGDFADYLNASPERQAEIRDARAAYGQADDTAKTPARDRFSVQPVTNADGTTSLVRVNLETGESTPIALPAGVAGAGKPTPTEQLSSAFQIRAQAADKTLGSFEDNLTSLPSQLELHLPPLLQSKQAQLYSQARDEFINAELRRESGAAIQPSEYARFDRIYAVHTGDRPEMIQQKREARRRVILGNQMAGGNLGKVVADGIQPAASHGAPADDALKILEQRRKNRGVQ